MPNQLIHETSPYLLQHAHNPVDWLPWSDRALEKAKQENKPIFLSIGYAACHWCHVMAHESFEDPQIAAILNTHFVPIKVDREERPDLDSIYMTAVVALNRQGGWPMSVFLTPQGQPFYGGTYFPPAPRHGLPSFRQVLISVVEAWRQNQSQILQSAENLTAFIESHQSWQPGTGSSIQLQQLQQAADILVASADETNGGWGTAPKFPAPMILEFLLLQQMNGNSDALPVINLTLEQMQKGGIYDVVGGGFHRYATDHAWTIPHFEKMLYDNAQLAAVYLHAFLVTGDPSFRSTCEATLDFMAREMRHPDGGFFSSLDADSEGQEGKFYLWSPEEILTIFGGQPHLESLFNFTYPLTAQGNFEGKNILRRESSLQEIADHFDLSITQTIADLNQAHSILRSNRAKRIRPGTDDKIITFWNALALRAFADAARYLDRKDYLEIAEGNAEFLINHLHPQDRLLRAWRQGHANQDAFLEDYAALVVALLSLFQSSPKQKWYQAAINLTREMQAAFQAEDGSFYTTRHDQHDIPVRTKEIQDNVTPSGNALAAQALSLLALYDGHEEYQAIADSLLFSIKDFAVQHPASFSYWLQVLNFSIQTIDQIALLFPDGQEPPSWPAQILWSAYRPNTIFAQSNYPPPQYAPFILLHRPLENSAPTIYLCRGKTCLPAITNQSQFEDSNLI